MGEGVVLQFVAALHRLLRGVDAGDADILFVPTFSPSPGGKPPPHDKKRALHATVIEGIEKARSRMVPLRAEKDIRPRAIVEGKGNQLVGRERDCQRGARFRVCTGCACPQQNYGG